MSTASLINLGSSTAKGGFKNEDEIVEKFNDWKTDDDARSWLKIMGYDVEKIEKVIAIKLHGHKTDVQVQITIFMKEAISAENLSIKLVSNPQGFNQIDKRRIDNYKEMWNIPDSVLSLLKLYTGETVPKKANPRDPRRLFFDEMSAKDRGKILRFVKKNKILIVSDILKGRGQFCAGWMLVILKVGKDVKWVLKSINEAMNLFGEGKVRFTDRGSMKIGKITMQRKGGDGGRDTAKMLQFKINPVELFKIDS